MGAARLGITGDHGAVVVAAAAFVVGAVVVVADDFQDVPLVFLCSGASLFCESCGEGEFK